MLCLPNLSLLANRIQKPIFIIDLETTGFIKPGIVEIACLKAKLDGSIAYKSTLVDPERPIDPRASAVHGITARDVHGQKAFSSHLEFIDTMYSTGLVSGFNVISYDMRVIRENALAYQYPSMSNAEALDARDIWKTLRCTSKGKLVDAAAHYGIAVENAHRALGDVLMTAKVLDAMLAESGIDRAISHIKKVC